MKKSATLLVFCLATLGVSSQTPFAINSANFPVFSTQLFARTSSPSGSNLVPAANGYWDFSANHGTAMATNAYTLETDPFYTSAGINVYIDDFKALNANLGYIIFYELDFNSGGVEEKGIYLNEQRYGLGGLTGNTNDSLIFPFQGAVYPNGRKLMQFPASYQSGWHTKSRRVVDFNLTVTAAGLHNTPFQHVFTIFRTDTIVAWGKMRVYANGAPSIAYNVLIDKNAQYAIDSFFVGGQPAPAALLTPFGMAQGQQTSLTNRYLVYREGNSTPLAVLNYGANNFTTAVNLFTDTENLTTTGLETPLKADYATTLFPNPSSTGQINLHIMGNAPKLSTYTVTDQLGRIVQSGPAVQEAEILTLQFNGQFPNGLYVLQVQDDKKQTVITEQFVLEQH
jgi:Secretion system C-terminal sorting domain